MTPPKKGKQANQENKSNQQSSKPVLMDADQFAKLLATVQKQHEESTKKILEEVANKFKQSTSGDNPNGASQSKFDQFNSKVESFRAYIERFENHLEYINLKDDKKKAQLLCESVGAENYNNLAAFLGPENPINKLKYDALKEKLSQLLQSKLSPVLAQHQFFECKQKEDQTIAEYVATLQRKLVDCEYTIKCPKPCNCDKKISIADVFLRTQFIRGIKDNSIRLHLLQSNLTDFADIVEDAITQESTKVESKEISESQSNQNTATNQSTPVNKINHQSRKKYNDKNSYKKDNNHQFNKNQNRPPIRDRSKSRSKVNFRELQIDGLCLRCGYNNHLINDCRHPPDKFKCESCSRTGHVKKVCISTLMKNRNDQAKSKNNVKYLISDDDEYDTIKVVGSIADGNDIIKIPLQIQGKQCELECDTGSRKTIVSLEYFNQHGFGDINELQQDDSVFRDYQKKKFRPLGFLMVNVKYKDREITEKMYVTDKSDVSIVGRLWLLPLKIIKIDDINVIPDDRIQEKDKIISELKTRFPDVFENKIGKVPDFVASFKLKEGAKPIYIPAKKVPYALLDKINKKIDENIKFGIYTQVETSEWGTPAVYTEKHDGSMRICGNYKLTLNQQVEDVRYKVPSVEEVFNQLESGNGKPRVYCKIDLRDAFSHLPVDAQTAAMQALTTHRGTYLVNVVNQGPKPAPAIFNHYANQLAMLVPGTIAFFDDFVIEGETIEECKKRVFQLFELFQKKGLHVNEKKCVFFAKRIEYLGHIVSEVGIQTSPSKIEAINKTEPPKSIDELRSFLGLVNHYHKFIPNAATILQPLYAVEENFKWNKRCDQAFQEVKKILTSDKVLVTYNMNWPLFIETDASPVGLSAILSHQLPDKSIRPIAYSSRTLSAAEKNYAQLDREALAIYWGVKKHYQYLYGREFTIITDNKPVQQILNPSKELPAYAHSRMLRYAVYLSQFNYKIQHRSGEQNKHADYLSRSPIGNYPLNVIDECNLLQDRCIDNISTLMTGNQITREILREETRKDPELSKLLVELKNGKNTDPDYSLNQGIIFYMNRIIIPKSLQSRILSELHKTHSGIVKMKQVARNHVFWKNINKDIEKLVKECKACGDVMKNPAKVQLHHWEETKTPFQRIHIDYAEYKQEKFLVIIDAHTKWLEVYYTRTEPTSIKTIEFLKDFFSRFGLCEQLVCDNATIFTSTEFKNFLIEHGIHQSFSAPNNPATNGQAERTVQIVKHKLKKMTDLQQPIEKKLLKIVADYRNTPIDGSETPAQRIFSFQPRTWFDSLKPSKKQSIERPSSFKIRQFEVGDRVQSRNYSKNGSLWQYGIIVNRLGKLHYLVKLDNGYQLKRHIDQLRASSVKKVTFEENEELLPPSKRRLVEIPAAEGRQQSPVSNNQREEEPEPIVVRRSNRSRKPISRMNL